MSTLLLLASALTLAGVAFFLGAITGGGLVKAAQADLLTELEDSRTDIASLIGGIVELSNLNQQVLVTLREERQRVPVFVSREAGGRPN